MYVIVCEELGGRDEELRFHAALKRFRMQGEWFKMTRECMEIAADLLLENEALTGEEYEATWALPVVPKSSGIPLPDGPRGRQHWQDGWEDCCVAAWDVLDDPAATAEMERSAREHLDACFMASMPPLPWIWFKPDGTEAIRVDSYP